MRKFRPSEPENLNLIPLMNLFVTMIPLLLLTAAFYHIGMVSVSVPTQSEEESDVATGKASVTINIQIGARGFTLTASSGTLSESELKDMDAFIPKKSGSQYDFDQLTQALERIKRRYEQSDTIMVIPSKETPYQLMIETMDAARSMQVQIQGKTRKIPLFPVVVVSSLVE